MLRDVFVDISILISCLFIAHQFNHKYTVTLASPLRIKVLFGFGHAILGIILIEFPIAISGAQFFDFRALPVMLSALYGGMSACLVTSATICVACLIAAGWQAESIGSALFILVLGIGCGLISYIKSGIWSKWLYMNLFGIAIATLLIYTVLPVKLPVRFYVYCFLGLSFGGLIAIMSTLYLRKSNQLFRQYEEDSTKDPLTGLNNVRYFFYMLDRFAADADRRRNGLAMLMVDIDFFKDINDTYGHPAGDFVLKEVGRVLSDNCRSYDVVSRNGGEEFSILLPGCTAEQALEIAERIRSGVEQRVFRLEDGQTMRLTVSVGVSVSKGQQLNAERLIRRTDEALYKAKRSGRNQVCLLELED